MSSKALKKISKREELKTVSQSAQQFTDNCLRMKAPVLKRFNWHNTSTFKETKHRLKAWNNIQLKSMPQWHLILVIIWKLWWQPINTHLIRHILPWSNRGRIRTNKNLWQKRKHKKGNNIGRLQLPQLLEWQEEWVRAFGSLDELRRS